MQKGQVCMWGMCGACMGMCGACVVHVRCACGGDLSAERSVHMWCTCGGGDLSAESLSHILRCYPHYRWLIVS